MSFQDERRAIEDRFAANWPFSVVPVAYDGVYFEPPKMGGDFVTCSILSGKGYQATIGDNPTFRYTGIIQNLMVIGRDKGSQQCRIYADSILPIWRRQIFALGFSGFIHTETPSYLPIGVKDGRYQAILSTPYRRDEQMVGTLTNINPPANSQGALLQHPVSGAVDGVNVTFTLPSTPISVLSTLLFLNGGLILAPGDFTLSGSTITMTLPPRLGSILVAYY